MTGLRDHNRPMAGGGGGLEKTGFCRRDVEKREEEAEVTLRIHIGEAGSGGAARV